LSRYAVLIRNLDEDVIQGQSSSAPSGDDIAYQYPRTRLEKAAVKHCNFRLDALPALKADSTQQFPRLSSTP
jgi:hypothetical protein